MNAFIAGVVFGALFMGAVFTLIITRMRKPKREIIDWTEKAYEPPVATKLLIKERTFEL